MNFMKHPHTEFSNTDLQQVTAMAVGLLTAIRRLISKHGQVITVKKKK